MIDRNSPLRDESFEEEARIIDEEIRQMRRSWLRDHMTLIYIAAGLLIAALVFFGIKWYNDSNNPTTRFIRASSKDLSTSFSFSITAEKDSSPVMTYAGTARFEPSSQKVSVVYDADYIDYTYRGVLYTDNEGSYQGNFYRGQWTVTDCTDRVHEFFDFFSDYRDVSFDSGAFLRFTGLNRYLYADELKSFVGKLRGRLSVDSDIAKITTVENDGTTEYVYDISFKALLEMIRTQGASVFYTSLDYDKFVSRLERSAGRIEQARCTFTCTVNASGYLSRMELVLDTGSSRYAVRCSMTDFGNAEPVIPDGFYTSAGISKPE